jgi:hypothetical protein
MFPLCLMALTRHIGWHSSSVTKASLGAGLVTSSYMEGDDADTPGVFQKMLSLATNEHVVNWDGGPFARSQIAAASFVHGYDLLIAPGVRLESQLAQHLHSTSSVIET